MSLPEPVRFCESCFMDDRIYFASGDEGLDCVLVSSERCPRH